MVAAAVVYSAASGTANTVVYSLITQVVAQQTLGGTLGLSAAVGSLTRVIAPALSGTVLAFARLLATHPLASTKGLMIEHGGVAAPHLLCCALLLAAYPLVARAMPQALVDADERERKVK